MHGFDLQNDLKIWSANKVDTNNFSVKSQSAALHFCHFTSFAEETKETNFSVNHQGKSSK